MIYFNIVDESLACVKNAFFSYFNNRVLYVSNSVTKMNMSESSFEHVRSFNDGVSLYWWYGNGRIFEANKTCFSNSSTAAGYNGQSIYTVLFNNDQTIQYVDLL